jgi:hypothetical protein
MADPNPDPARITDELWWVWTQCLLTIAGARLGGIYASKECYHNTVQANRIRWPFAYCVRLALDLTGLLDKARAIDLTMSTAQMKLHTGRLRAAAIHPGDDRLKGVREFIGTLDGVTVFCMIRDTDSGPWRVDWSRDDSHTWHIHVSVWTFYVNSMAAMEALVSVLSGETWESWQARKGGEAMAEMFLVDGGPAVMASTGGMRWGFPNWDAATRWAAFWGVPTTGLRSVVGADLDALLGPDRNSLVNPQHPPVAVTDHVHEVPATTSGLPVEAG